MRPGQQNNKRMRGRNRKGPNPLTRSYESNGPDVKVRGTALHIAEKYGQLARDAHSSGDRVAAESYLQHAEHYYRIIMAAQAQMPQQQGQQFYRNDEGDDDGEEQDLQFGHPRPHQNGYPQQHHQGGEGQPHMNGGNNGYAQQASEGDGEGDGEDAPQPYPDQRGGQPRHGQGYGQPRSVQQGQPQPAPQPQGQEGGEINNNAGEFQGLPGNAEFRGGRRRRSNRGRGRRPDGGNFGGDEQRADGGAQRDPEFSSEE